MSKLVILILSGLSAAIAGLVLTNWLADSAATTAWLLVRLVAVLALLGISIATWRYFRSGTTEIPVETRLLVGGLCLVVLGSAGFSFSLHLGTPGRVADYWGVSISVITITQGCLTVYHLWQCALRREESHIGFEI